MGFTFLGNLGWDMPEEQRQGCDYTPMLELKFYDGTDYVHNYICGQPLPTWWVGTIGYTYEHI